jgi:flagellar motility protein MotE (MotC chaperone)
MLCLLNLLAVGGLLGYLIATQRVDKTKAVVIADLLRHPGTPENLRLGVNALLTPAAATAPATGPASRPALAHLDGPATAEARIDFARQAMEQERLRLELEAQDLRHRQELLERLQARVEADRKKVDEDRKSFDRLVAQSNSKSNDESFTRTMALYDELKTKQIKELFGTMAPELAARYLSAMTPERAAKIIAEFKTEDDRKRLAPILERFTGSGTASASASLAATPPATPAPAAVPASPSAPPAPGGTP